jgi:uncharacterized membrane protein
MKLLIEENCWMRKISLATGARLNKSHCVTPALQATTAPPSLTGRSRIESVDLLRGLIMVLMALDHVRDFFTNVHYDPLDLDKTNAALFFTRWITHFCAPVFIFLAGTGACLSKTRGKTKGELAWFLFTRGLWLALLEITYVRCLGWEFNFDFHHISAAILWAIGWSMVALAGLVFLPTWGVAAFGLSLIVLHNAFDAIRPESWGSLGWLWTILHQGGAFDPAPGYTFLAAYPLVPWIGVMAAGYAFGSILLKEPVARRKWMLGTGVTLTASFVLLRWTNLYGNPHPWTAQNTFLFTLFSFIDCHKYPPSLLYLLMTLGPALVLLSFFDQRTPRLLRPLLVFGRVPLFYYLLHLPLIHALAVLTARLRYGRADWLFHSPFANQSADIPADNGFGLPVIYGIWLGVVLMLYPACRWFAELKRRRREPWLSYL